MNAYTRKPVTKTFEASDGKMRHTVTIPAGLRCTRIEQGSTAGKYFLDEFPENIFKRGSFTLCDAEVYGIVLEPDEVLKPATGNIEWSRVTKQDRVIELHYAFLVEHPDLTVSSVIWSSYNALEAMTRLRLLQKHWGK